MRRRTRTGVSGIYARRRQLLFQSCIRIGRMPDGTRAMRIASSRPPDSAIARPLARSTAKADRSRNPAARGVRAISRRNAWSPIAIDLPGGPAERARSARCAARRAFLELARSAVFSPSEPIVSVARWGGRPGLPPRASLEPAVGGVQPHSWSATPAWAFLMRWLRTYRRLAELVVSPSGRSA